MRFLVPLACIAVVWFYAAKVATAAVPGIPVETGTPLYTILDPGSPVDVFGVSMAATRGHVAVTAQRRQVAGHTQAGAVYLFDEMTGQLQHSILNPEPTQNDEFGMSVAFVGNDLLVGAYGDDFGASAAGSAYLFDTATGSLKQTIRNPEPQAAAVFGISASAINDGFAVGAIGVNRTFAGVGAVYLFDNAGNHTLTLDNPNPSVPASSFGGALASTDSLIAVGARGSRHSSVPFSPRAGVVQVFDTTTGQFLNTLRSMHPVEEGQFGISVAAIDGKVVVGAPMETVNGQTDSGRVYVFDGHSGALEFEIENPTGGEDEWFGYSVEIAAGNILVGAPRKFDGRARAGGAYLFDLETRDLLALYESPRDRGDEFGWAVAGTNTTAFASTWVDRRVYAFTAVPEPATLLVAAIGGVACLSGGRPRSVCRRGIRRNSNLR